MLIYFALILADISAIAKIYGKPTERDGEMFMTIDKMVVDFTMKNARFKVKDNVNTQNVLGNQIHAINLFRNKRICFPLSQERQSTNSSTKTPTN